MGGGVLEPANPKKSKNSKHVRDVRVLDLALLKGSLSPSQNENNINKDLHCALSEFKLIQCIQRKLGHRDSVMHELSSSVNKVNEALTKVRTIEDRLPLTFEKSSLLLFISWLLIKDIYNVYTS